MNITREQILEKISGPGKFECLTVPDWIAWQATMEGDGDIIGDNEGGESYTRLDAPIFTTDDPLTDEEREEYGQYVGVIFHECTRGFVSATWYERKEDFEGDWAELISYYSEEDDCEADSFDQQITKGAAYLDIHTPGWYDRINLADFDMSSCLKCVLGQLFGLYTYGLDSNWTIQDEIDHGFELQNEDRGNDKVTRQWTKKWKEYIQSRKNK